MSCTAVESGVMADLQKQEKEPLQPLWDYSDDHRGHHFGQSRGSPLPLSSTNSTDGVMEHPFTMQLTPGVALLQAEMEAGQGRRERVI